MRRGGPAGKWCSNAPRWTLLAVLLLAASLAPAATAEWQAAALDQLHALESTLLSKEAQLLQVREDLAAVRAAEERGGRRMVRRAAFDVGSAACKIFVADDDLHAGSVPKHRLFRAGGRAAQRRPRPWPGRAVQ